MGVTTFIKTLEKRFVEDVKKQPRPDVVDTSNVESLRSYLWEGFALWFLQNRDDLLAEEWAQLGWVDLPAEDTTVSYQVREDCLAQIEAWLNDENSPATSAPAIQP